ncbi:receptor-like protein 33 [Salvia splendens]|uniref:receptor-like protein 33 n=1 Tax=Salvia splendens TaxID=180675 RepID=UPI001C25FEFA|nr:receptor-like protein 33 [Salvia splendens]
MDSLLSSIHFTGFRALEWDSEGISGRIGESSALFQLTYLSRLGLSSNDFTTTEIPNQFHRLPNLAILDLSESGFKGPIPSTLANLTQLVELYLPTNFLTGSIPSFHNCKNLESIKLRDNNLMGSLSHLHFQGLTNLSRLDLSHNSLNGTIPHHLFTLPSIGVLHLSNNQFSGQIKEISILAYSNLAELYLSVNRIGGPIPNFFFQLRNMEIVYLSDNLFNGTFKLNKIRSLTILSELSLSNNNLSVDTTNMSSSSNLNLLHMSSCNLHDFPNLRNLSYLADLDLSNNHLRGDIPSWIWGSGMISLNLSLNLLTDLQKPYHIPTSLYTLDLHSNLLSCEFPLLRPDANANENESDYYFANFLFLANNRLTGVIPTSICSISRLMVLDLSFNNLIGSIPPCLLQESYYLKVLNLRGNNFIGVIPDTFNWECGLKTFDVSDNNLGGKIPKSLANCVELAVMNVGNNNFDDSFPCMALPESLKVLVLRSNRFHGELRCGKSWPDLQILDISSNHLSGTLDSLNFSSWRGMMLQSQAHLRRSPSDILNASYLYRDEVTIIVKNVEVRLVKIWPDFTCIDLSSNHFEKEIPDAIGSLTSLYLLNLSHNSLTHAIPRSLGALTELGSLDLSSNKLTGRIPDELTKLDFLSFLNLSYNHLTGLIPTSSHFQTFSADSFEGNAGLSGFPLNGSFNNRPPPGPSPSEDSEPKEEEIEWEYVFAASGYVVGFGSIAWILLCCRSLRERYFEKIEEVADKIFFERGRRKRRHERRVRRRREERNAVRRRHHQ